MTPRVLSLLVPALLGTLAVDPATANTRLFPVADIPAELAAGNAFVDDDNRPHASRPIAGVPLATWISSASLADPDRRDRVRQLLESGTAILVTSDDDTPRHELETFGIEPAARTAIFHRTREGLHVASVARAVDQPDARIGWQQATDAVLASMDPPSRSSAHARVDTVDGVGEVSPEAPYLKVFDQAFGATGGSASQTIIVNRHTTASLDDKVITVAATLAVRPHDNGIAMGGDRFAEDGVGKVLFVPDTYRARTSLTWDGDAPAPRLTFAIPTTSDVTKGKILQEEVRRTSFGGSVGGELAAGLKEKGIGATGKVAFSLNWTSEVTTRMVVDMNVQDYSVYTTTANGGSSSEQVWAFPLAADIAAKTTYFGEKQLSTQRLTPMMHRADLQVASEWRVPGRYEGAIRIASRGSVDNRVYRIVPHGVTANEVREDSASQAQPVVESRVDLSSPHLTRSPTVLVQSLSGFGKCLQAAGDDVVLSPCAKSDIAQQWNFEEDDSYRNRATGKCLTMEPSDGRVHLQACDGHVRTQRWQWSADRIHSLHDGGTTARLHVRDGVLSGAFDATRHQRIAPNPHHALLRPWSSYPSAPTMADWVPVLSGKPPAFIPLEGVAYRDIDVSERWQTLPVREGL